MTAPWWTRTWPDADDERPSQYDEPAEHELADEESSRVERDLTRDC
jgi:hypothetical protein